MGGVGGGARRRCTVWRARQNENCGAHKWDTRELVDRTGLDRTGTQPLGGWVGPTKWVSRQA